MLDHQLVGLYPSFAFPDEWGPPPLNDPPFFCNYARAFDSDWQCPDPNNKYGTNRPDNNAMLTYDATYVFGIGLQGTEQKDHPSLQQALTQITGTQAIQGVSGQISFDKNGDPIQKEVLMLKIDQSGFTHEVWQNGCLRVNSC